MENSYRIKCANIGSWFNRVGRQDKLQAAAESPSDEARFLERLRQHPELKARFQSILDLAPAAAGPIQTAAAVEEQVLVKLRELGHATMHPWAAQAEQRLADETKATDDPVRRRKKKRGRGGVCSDWCAYRIGSGAAGAGVICDRCRRGWASVRADGHDGWIGC